jgi:hypothetical protein
MELREQEKSFRKKSWFLNGQIFYHWERRFDRLMARTVATGMKMATVAVLMRKADKAAMVIHTARMSLDSPFPASLCKRREKVCTNRCAPGLHLRRTWRQLLPLQDSRTHGVLIWIDQAEHCQDNGDAQGYYLNRQFPGYE